MQDNEKQERQVRRPYEKPQIKRFPLRPEEAVLGHCKTSGGSGPTGIGCRNVGACQSIGS